MVFIVRLKTLIIPSACIVTLTKTRLRFGDRRLGLLDNLWFSNISNHEVRTIKTSVIMMVGIGTENRVPVVDIFSEKENDRKYVTGGYISEDGKLRCGYSSFQGKRVTMEDFYDVKISKVNGQSVCLFGIFDGHGGSRAAEYLKEHLFENLMKHPKFLTDTKAAISETYKQTDSNFLDAEKDTYRDDGSTASTAVLVGNHLYVANVGDSRTVGSRAGKAIPLSEDHKPNRSDERKRIENAGGVVMWAGTWRVGGVLAMSRAFGNRMLKQFVVAEPEIQEQEINEELELLVLASDGLWDVVPNEDAVSIAQSEEEPEAAARKLTETAFNRGSADNITCIVVRFLHDHIHPGDLSKQINTDLGSADTQGQTKPTIASADATNQADHTLCSAETVNQTQKSFESAQTVEQTKPRIGAADVPTQSEPGQDPQTPPDALNQAKPSNSTVDIQHK
ncbi:hypothetical protein Droror1_Dr00017686 [Drosera rotundifolia]